MEAFFDLSILGQLMNYLMGFMTSIVAIYVKRTIDNRASRKRTLHALRDELQNNLEVLKKATRIYMLRTVAWDIARSYLAEKEDALFLELSKVYSMINARNNVLFLHNISLCFGKTFTLELDDKYTDSGEWLDEYAEELMRYITKGISDLNRSLD